MFKLLARAGRDESQSVPFRAPYELSSHWLMRTGLQQLISETVERARDSFIAELGCLPEKPSLLQLDDPATLRSGYYALLRVHWRD